MSEKSSDPRRFPTGAIICALLGIIALSSIAIMIRYFSMEPLRAVMYSLGAYAACVAVSGAIYLLVRLISRNRFSEIHSSTFGNLSLDFIQKLHFPVIICDGKGKILWYNRIFVAQLRTRGSVLGKDIGDMCIVKKEEPAKEGDKALTAKTEDVVKGEGDMRGMKAEDVVKKDDNGMRGMKAEDVIRCDGEDGIEVRFLDAPENESEQTVYMAKGYEVTSRGEKYYMALFFDYTKMKSLKERLNKENVIVAYAVIDNIDELLQYVQKVYTETASSVEAVLRRHIESVGGIVRDYGDNKYMCVFEQKNLDKFIEDKFSMLDDVRKIQAGDSSIPVTVSIGIARIDGTLIEKERLAQSALDLALRRGGDQVVIKSEDDIECYGGKTNAVQKRAKTHSRVIATKFKLLVEKCSNVIVMGHRFADFDAIASCLAVARIATTLGKKANIIADKSDANLENCFKRLAMIPEYDTMFVDKIEAQDLIESKTLVVVVDVNNLSFCEAPDIVNSVEDFVVIDHHRKTTEYTRKPVLEYIEPSESSASELLSEFIEQLLPPGTLPKVEADILFAGLLLDTKKFTHNAGVRAFSSALYLRGEGASPIDAEALFKTKIKDFLSEAKFESNVVLYKSVIAIAFNDNEDNSPIVRVSASKAADRLLSVDGVQAAFALCKIDDTVHISARSQGKINVQLILEKMGGGGHFDAAGAQVRNSSTATALTTLRAAIDEYLATNN